MTALHTPIAIRAYSERPDTEPLGAKKQKRDSKSSPRTLIFDCETTIDATQQLRVGFYQIRKEGTLKEEGVFYDPDAITSKDRGLIRRYADKRDLCCLQVSTFRVSVFLKYAYTRCATVVGFNLPFDLSRIAIDHGAARRRPMRGGFSFLLSRHTYHPRVRVKHLNPRAALIDFARPGEDESTRAMRKRGIYVPAFRGHFVDIKTLAVALLSRRFTLRSLAAYLGTETQKLDAEEHGVITNDYLDYARADVQTTWECFEELERRYVTHGLDNAMSKLLSEASIGKTYLRQMGITPFLGCDPEFPRELFGQIFCAYYGGRAEIRNRRVIQEVVYCDFKSMYPTVNALMGLWEFVIADGMTWNDSTTATREFLNNVTLDDLPQPDTWRQLRTLVQLKPDDDVFPVRAKYDYKSFTIGLNYLTTDKPLWYTLADCIASKLTTGKMPNIEKAITFQPGPPQQGLQAVEILGRDDYRINPAEDDFFTRLIDLRDEAKTNDDSIQKTLKIIANSTSYGIFIEVNRDDASKSEELDIFGPNSECFSTHIKAIEQPGRYFHPLLGVLITGAARLMLGIVEKKTIDFGLDWAFCDTDSLAIVKPDEMPRHAFHKTAKKVIDWFIPLNPYQKPGSILKLEEVNNAINSEIAEPLYCFAISAKRYALFNVDADGNPVLRKASAHGLGQLIDPYSDTEAPKELIAPRVPLTEIGVHRWQHDFWIKIIQAALDGTPDQVALDWHDALSSPAASRYSASTPALLKWLDKWNEGKPYRDQVRPFGFLLSYTARTGVFAPCGEGVVVDEVKAGRPPKTHEPKPIAPYDSNPISAVSKVFDRDTGQPVDPSQLKTYAEALAQYHLSPESKFENGRFLDRGRTERRHVVATEFVLIGKEANMVGESGEQHPVEDAVQEFKD